MLRYVLQRLYSICFWFKAIPSNNVLHFSAGYDVFCYVMQCEFSNYAGINFVESVFISAMICALSIAISFGCVISLHVVEGRRHPFY